MPEITTEEEAEAKSIIDRAAQQSSRARARGMEADPGPVGAKDVKRLIREEKAKRGESSPSDESSSLEFEDFGEDVGAEPGTAGPLAAGVPDGFPLPKAMVFPDGWQVWFLRFESRDTNMPKKGTLWHDPENHDAPPVLCRFAVLWNLSWPDEKRALKRAAGNPASVIEECAMAMIRSVDGHVADWLHASGPDSVQQFWSEIGGKCRHVLRGIYLKTHTMAPEESLRFFERCATVRTVG